MCCCRCQQSAASDETDAPSQSVMFERQIHVVARGASADSWPVVRFSCRSGCDCDGRCCWNDLLVACVRVVVDGEVTYERTRCSWLRQRSCDDGSGMR
eukprot:scaffold346_cov184-Alexandrium_tamarense.AAC.3